MACDRAVVIDRQAASRRSDAHTATDIGRPRRVIAFTWLELVHPNAASPRIVAIALSIYLVVTVAGLALWGRGWASQGDPFGALFALIASLAPSPRTRRGDSVARAPRPAPRPLRAPRNRRTRVSCTRIHDVRRARRTRFWTGLVGDSGVLLNSAGLLWTIGAVYALYRLAVSAMPIIAGVPTEDRDPDATANMFIHSLIPIALAYAVAHYFSLLVLRGPNLHRAALGPAGPRLGPVRDRRMEDQLHGADAEHDRLRPGRRDRHRQSRAVILAHDRAISRYPLKVATKTQYPMLAVMVAYTVGALVILLGG